MRRLASLLCLCLAVVAHAADVPTERAFTDEYVAAVRAAFPAIKTEIVKPLEVRMTLGDGKTSTAYLGNAYNDVQRDPASKATIIARHVSSVADLVAIDDVIDVRNIVPVIKDRAWVVETQQARQASAGGAAVQYVFDEFNADLLIVYAEDKPTNIHYFEASALQKAGVERKKLTDQLFVFRKGKFQRYPR